MIVLILIIMLIISLFKPDILLSKTIKEKANDEQKVILTKNSRKFYSITIGLIESLALVRYNEMVGSILLIIFIVLLLKFGLPAIKENSQIQKELK